MSEEPTIEDSRDSQEPSESSVEPLKLCDLKGAVLTWTDRHGNERRVEFND